MNNHNPPENTPPHVNPALIEKFINVQEKELVIRGQELELKKLNDSNSHEYAKAALDANVTDREAERKNNANILKYGYIFGGAVIFLLVILFVFALFLNKDQIVMEILKAIIFIGSGGISGYALGKKSTNNKD